jgi:glycosyltransferase involved in cell wall biosynthesis
MKKILLISPYWREKHRWMVSGYKLAELWQRLGYEVVAVCMGESSRVERVSDTLTIHYRKDYFLPDPLNFGIAFGFWLYVRKIIKSDNPDLLICNKVLFWTSFALIPLRLCGYKFLLLTDALVGMTWWPRSFIPKLIMGAGAWTVGWLVLLSAKKIVFYHPQPERLLSRLGIKHKSMVIPTGIDLRAVSPSTVLRTGSKRLAVSNNEEVVVTYVGRLESVKGVDDFLAAVVPLKNDYTNMKIQVVGWFKEENSIVKEYERDVVFMGLRDDVPNILAGTDIFVLPSYSEGLSNALMEAMSSGCACIATEVGGNRYLIQNGVSGLLFLPGDRQALQAHMRRLVDDKSKRESLGRCARERIEQEFDWKVISKKYETLFAEYLPLTANR